MNTALMVPEVEFDSLKLESTNVGDSVGCAVVVVKLLVPPSVGSGDSVGVEGPEVTFVVVGLTVDDTAEGAIVGLTISFVETMVGLAVGIPETGIEVAVPLLSCPICQSVNGTTASFHV